MTSYDSVEHPGLLKKLKSRGIAKFIAYEVSLESTIANYGKYFDINCNDLHGSDDLRVIEFSGENSSEKFSFDELSNLTFYEPEQPHTLDIYMVGV